MADEPRPAPSAESRPPSAEGPEASPEAPPPLRHAGGFTLDLSSGRAPSAPRKRKGPPPLVQQTINLSTPRPPRAEAPASSAEAPRPAPAPKPPGGTPARSGGGPGRAGRPPGGSTLADLLDPETLARLRGKA